MQVKWVPTLQSLEWLKSLKRLAMSNIGEHVEQMELSDIISCSV